MYVHRIHGFQTWKWKDRTMCYVLKHRNGEDDPKMSIDIRTTSCDMQGALSMVLSMVGLGWHMRARIMAGVMESNQMSDPYGIVCAAGLACLHWSGIGSRRWRAARSHRAGLPLATCRVVRGQSASWSVCLHDVWCDSVAIGGLLRLEVSKCGMDM